MTRSLEDAYTASKKETALQNRLWLDSPWHGFFDIRDPMKQPPTGIAEDTLAHIAKAFSTEPGDGFKLHSGNAQLVNVSNIQFVEQMFLILISPLYNTISSEKTSKFTR